MNAAQLASQLKQLATMLGASTAVAGYFTSELGVAIIGVFLALGSAALQWRAQTNTAIIDTAAKLPEVKEVIVSSPKVAMATTETNVRSARK